MPVEIPTEGFLQADLDRLPGSYAIEQLPNGQAVVTIGVAISLGYPTLEVAEAETSRLIRAGLEQRALDRARGFIE